MKTRTGTLRSVLAISLAGLLWGALSSAVQYLFTAAQVPPAGLVAIRLLAAGGIFVAAAAVLRLKEMLRVWENFRNVRDIAVSGVLLFLAHETFFETIYCSNAATGAIFVTLEPLAAALWYAAVHRKPVSRTEVFCFFLALTGVAFIITDGDFTGLKFSPLVLFWGTVCTAVSAAYSIQPARVIHECGALPVSAWSILFGGVAAGIFSPPWNVPFIWNTGTAAAFAFVVIAGTIIPFTLYLFGLRYVNAVIAGLLNCMEPLSAVFFSVVLLGDILGFWQGLGVALVILNVVLIALSKRRT